MNEVIHVFLYSLIGVWTIVGIVLCGYLGMKIGQGK